MEKRIELGTPKDLAQAIYNGLLESDLHGDTRVSMLGSVKAHTKDYLAQVLTAALMQCQTENETALIQQICDRLGLEGGAQKKSE